MKIDTSEMKNGIWLIDGEMVTYLSEKDEDLKAQVKSCLLNCRNKACEKLYGKLKKELPEETFNGFIKSPVKLTVLCEELIDFITERIKNETSDA